MRMTSLELEDRLPNGESRVLWTFSELAGCSYAQPLSLFLLRLFPVLPRHGAKLARSFSKPLLFEKDPLHRWQRLRPDARAVPYLFVISGLASAGREPRKKPENSAFWWRWQLRRRRRRRRRRGNPHRRLELAASGSRMSRGGLLSPWCTRCRRRGVRDELN